MPWRIDVTTCIERRKVKEAMSDKPSFEQLMNNLQKELVDMTWALKGSKEDEDYTIGRIVLAITALKQLHAKRTKS